MCQCDPLSSITCAFLLLVALQDVPVVPRWCWEGELEQLFLGLSAEMHRCIGVVMPHLLQQYTVCMCCSSGAVLSHFFCHSQKGYWQLLPWSECPTIPLEMVERAAMEQTAKSLGEEGGKGLKKECDTLKEKWANSWLGITVSQRGCSTQGGLLWRDASYLHSSSVAYFSLLLQFWKSQSSLVFSYWPPPLPLLLNWYLLSGVRAQTSVVAFLLCKDFAEQSS